MTHKLKDPESKRKVLILNIMSKSNDLGFFGDWLIDYYLLRYIALQEIIEGEKGKISTFNLQDVTSLLIHFKVTCKTVLTNN